MLSTTLTEAQIIWRKTMRNS